MPTRKLAHSNSSHLKESWDQDSDVDSEEEFPIHSGPPTPTGFLHLPREIRLEIYELACLPVRTIHRYLLYDSANRWGRNALTIVHTYPSTGALLATCKQIHWEVSSFLNIAGAHLGRGTVRVIGDASCLDTPAFKGLLHCATLPLTKCTTVPKELVDSFGQEENDLGAQTIRSHHELHALLGSIDNKGPKVIELAIEDPLPQWGHHQGRPTQYWAGLAHDIKRFDTWAHVKSRSIGVELEVVIRPAMLSESGVLQWDKERPLQQIWPSKRKARAQKIIRQEGRLIEDEEWKTRWVDEKRSRAGFRAYLKNDRFGLRRYDHCFPQNNGEWMLMIPRRKSFRGDWTCCKIIDWWWKCPSFSPWAGYRRKHYRDRYTWRYDYLAGQGHGSYMPFFKTGSILVHFHETEREQRLEVECGDVEHA